MEIGNKWVTRMVQLSRGGAGLKFDNSSGCQVRILSIDCSIPYLLKDENYRIGGWAIELSIWLRALKNAGHEAAVLTWKGALAHVGSDPRIKLIQTYDPAQGVRGVTLLS
jgi:hypothetical protein